jgi:ATP-binding cassette, subfamily B, bacterial
MSRSAHHDEASRRGHSDLALYRRFVRQIRPCGASLAGVLLLSLLGSLLGLLTPLPLKIAVDNVVNSRPLPHPLAMLLPDRVALSSAGVLAFAAGLLIGISVLTQTQALMTSLLGTWTAEKLVLNFRARLFSHAQRLSASYHDTRGTADSIYRIQQDSTALQYLTIDGLIPFASASAVILGMIYVTTRIDWQLALLALSVAPIIYTASASYRRMLRAQSRRVKQLETSALAVVQEALGALRVVKAFGREEHEEDRFVLSSREGMRARIRLALVQGRYGLLVGLTVATGTAAVLWLGTRHVRAGVLTIGDLFLVMAYLGQLYEPLKTVGRKSATLQGYLASLERAFALLDELPDVVDYPNARHLSRASGAVVFQNVSFCYRKGQPVLREVSFEVPPGARVGIAGRTGAGKTTLVSMLGRFHDPSSGRILLDGVDLLDFKLEDLRGQLAMVLQEPLLFSTSIAENIAYGRPEATEKEIQDAARSANAHDFIIGLPDGYQTLVGERGMQLSGGERQRISLARAFLKDAPILVLDEPTSSVDMDTEEGILDAMERLMRGRTTFVIAHRLTTLRHCDVVLQMEGGRVVSVTSGSEGRLPVYTGRLASTVEAARP